MTKVTFNIIILKWTGGVFSQMWTGKQSGILRSYHVVKNCTLIMDCGEPLEPKTPIIRKQR